MYILGIESSCDETSVAIVTTGGSLDERLRAMIVLSQDHQDYGGVIPEFSARSHLNALPLITEKVLDKAGLAFSDLTSLAVTGGPGLMGGLLVGLMFCKGLSLSLGKPFKMIDHLEGHILTARLSHFISFPYLMLLVSGGHCQILDVKSLGHYTILSQTLDDSVGEVFDKVSRLLGFSYPGGPIVESLANKGDPFKFLLPIPMKGKDNMSFSGLKNAVRLLIQKLSPLSDQDRFDIAASFQFSVAQSLKEALKRVIPKTSSKTFVMAGGVASNASLRIQMKEFAQGCGLSFVVPPPYLCTDNAAMIAWVGMEYFGEFSTMNVRAYPRAL